MKTIRDLILAAAGILETRGDLVTIENLPFEAPEALPLREGPAGPAAPPGGVELLQRTFSKEWVNKYRYVVIGVFVGFVALGVFLALRARTKAKTKKGETPVVVAPEQLVEKQLASREAAQREADEAAMLELKMPHVTSNKAMVLKQLLADSAKKDASATVQLLRSWIHEEER